MTLRPYASQPGRLAGQLFTDIAVLTWSFAWIWVAVQLHQAVVSMGEAGFRVRDGADGVATHLEDAGSDAERVPVAGDALAAPLRAAGRAASTLSDAGQQLGDGVTGAAVPLALALLTATVLPLAIPWLLLRVRFARRAGATAELAASPAGTRLLALRALANAPARRLAAVDPDPVGAWTREDGDVTAALAALELRRMGLPYRPPLRQE